jgi:hypothetical protein
MHFDLQHRDGLYYCSTDVYTVDHDPVRVACHRTQAPPPATGLPRPKFIPTSKARQIESEVWMLLVRYKFLTRRMPTAWIRRAHDSSMLSRPQRTC